MTQVINSYNSNDQECITKNNSIQNNIDIFDAIIIGGGMVGAAVALGLAKQKKKVAVIEEYTPAPFDGAQPIDLRVSAIIEEYTPAPFDGAQPIDLRVSAISLTSINLLKQLGAWEAIETKRALPYLGLETWEMEQCHTRFHADDLNVPHLGYMIENRIVQLGLWEQFEQYDNLKVITPDSLDKLTFADKKGDMKGDEYNIVTLASGRQLKSKWVIGADGANSQVRTQANIGLTAWDYRQHCMLINVALPNDSAPQDTTWQWFTPSGPRAFLPMPPVKINGQGSQLHKDQSQSEQYQGSLVWYDSPERIAQLQQLSNERLKQEVITHFPQKLGDIEVLNKGSFPLTRRHANQYISKGCILVGDSAHTINPLAGQGVNLGFKDVHALLEVIADKGLDDPEQLSAYEKLRRKDNLLMQTGMDVFYTTFSNEILPLKLLRNGLLKVADNSGAVKNQMLKYALGL